MPTIDIPDRICPHCGGTKWFMFIQDGYTKYHCHEKKKERWKTWHMENPGIHKLYRRKSGREKSKKLSDTYIKERLIYGTGLKFKDVTPEMITRFRNYAKTKRQLKNLENGKRKQTEQAEADRRRSLSNGRESKERIREVQQSQLSKRSSVSLSLQHASNERSNALCSTRNKKVNRNQLKFNNMSRRSIFKTAEVLEIKKQIRQGSKVKQMAKRLAPQYNVTEEQMLSKLYYISANTYMMRGRPSKKTKTPAAPVTRVEKPTDNTSVVGKKVVMYSDHIRIYFK